MRRLSMNLNPSCVASINNDELEMAKVVWMSGIEYVSGALCKCGKKGQHTHDKMLLATHRRAATTNPDCNRLYVRSQVTRKTAPTEDELFARIRFTAVAAMVRTRSRDLSKISQDQMAFIAQKDLAGGKKTMKAWYWMTCGNEYDAQHPRG